MESLTFNEILKISYVIPVLLVMSVFCVMFAIERWFYYLRYASVSNRLLERVRSHLKNGNLKDAKQEALRSGGLAAEAIAAQIDAVHMPRNERESLLVFYHQRSMDLLGRRLWIFGTLSFICPLIGLLGTVLGVIRSFHDLAASGSGGPSIVAAGISEALIATAAGILVAVSAALLYNYFNVRMKEALTKMNLFGQEMIFLTHGRTAK
jgi:biopolymer transport protein ExbB